MSRGNRLASPMRGSRELVEWCPPRESNPDRPLRRREPCPLGQEGGCALQRRQGVRRCGVGPVREHHGAVERVVALGHDPVLVGWHGILAGLSELKPVLEPSQLLTRLVDVHVVHFLSAGYAADFPVSG